MKSLPVKPFYSKIATIIFLLPLIFSLNIALAIIYGPETLDENGIDKVFHILGGVSISLSAAGVLWHLIHQNKIQLQDANVFRALVFGIVCFAVISWEVFEYFALFPLFSSVVSYSDTIIDMIFGLAGGLFAMYFVRRPVG